MSYCYKRSNSYAHCYHEKELVTSVNPPVRIEVCCWCKDERSVPAVQTVEHPEHGPFAKKEWWK